MKPIFTLAAALTIVSPVQARLTASEKRMVQVVDAEQDRSLALLERLVNQNSGTMNVDGVAKVGAMMRAELEPLGFRVVWKALPQTKRAGHLIATHEGRRGSKRLLLIGHLDTVFEPSSPFQRYTRSRDKATGPGVGDDKGGMVVMVAALRAMRAAGSLKGANLEIHLTGDEESTGRPIEVAREDLIAAGKRADAALDFEGLSQEEGRDMGSIARRSSNSWMLRTTAKSGHSSGIFGNGVGDGAAFELARVLAAFRTELPEENLTFNVGIAATGATAELSTDAAGVTATGKTNIIPSVGIARGDFRTLSEEQTLRVQAKMRAIVSRHLPGASATISFDEGYPPMAPTQGNRTLLRRLNEVNADMGLPVMGELHPSKRGAGDIAFVAKDVDGLVGLGPAGDGSHAPGEVVDLPSIQRQAKRAAILMSRLASETRR